MNRNITLVLLFLLLSPMVLAETPVFQSRQIGPKQDRIAVKVYTDKSEYKVGQEMDITLKASANCHFILYYVDSKGNAQVIVPSAFSKKNQLRKNVLFKVRDNQGRKLEQKGPSGYERLQIIATRQPVDLFEFGNCLNPNTGEVYNPQIFVSDFRQELASRVEQRRAIGPKEDSAYGEFGLAEITYTVR